MQNPENEDVGGRGEKDEVGGSGLTKDVGGSGMIPGAEDGGIKILKVEAKFPKEGHTINVRVRRWSGQGSGGGVGGGG